MLGIWVEVGTAQTSTPIPDEDIPDENLRTALKTALTVDQLTQENMKSITEFTDNFPASGAEIERLTGLRYAINLTILSLSGHEITDISELANLTKLTKVLLTKNEVSVIPDMSALTALKTLHLDD